MSPVCIPARTIRSFSAADHFRRPFISPIAHPSWLKIGAQPPPITNLADVPEWVKHYTGRLTLAAAGNPAMLPHEVNQNNVHNLKNPCMPRVAWKCCPIPHPREACDGRSHSGDRSRQVQQRLLLVRAGIQTMRL